MTHALLRSLFDTAVASADPLQETRDALTQRLAQRPGDGRGWIISVGKASPRMAHAAMLAAADTELEIVGGIVVGPEHTDVDAPLEFVVGDHPVPGARSRHAATRLGALVQAVLPADHALVLVSGGTSSLIAAPANGVDAAEFDTLMRGLPFLGLDIHGMNAERRRVLQWGGGRLGAALAPARVHQVLLSDVIGDDPAIIGSGPCVPDAALAASAEFAHIDPPVVLGRTMIHDGISQTASASGIPLEIHAVALDGDAATRGADLARWLVTEAPAGVHCWTGETTVALGETHGRGGRCQEFALAAALTLDAHRKSARRVTILAAGTDGRDGPTDAAGAIVDRDTAPAIRARGLDPMAALEQHDAYGALDAARALIRTGHTGTNVADVVLAMVG